MFLYIIIRNFQMSFEHSSCYFFNQVIGILISTLVLMGIINYIKKNFLLVRNNFGIDR